VSLYHRVFATNQKQSQSVKGFSKTFSIIEEINSDSSCKTFQLKNILSASADCIMGLYTEKLGHS